MNKPLLTLLLLLPSVAGAATLQQVRDRADQILGSFWTNDLLPAQQTYFTNNGRYAQCLVTGNIPNTNAADAQVAEIVGDNITATLHDQAETCVDVVGDLNTQKPFILWIDTFESATHFGFNARIFASYNGTIYTRSRCYGISKADSTEGIDEGCATPSEGWRQALTDEDRNSQRP